MTITAAPPLAATDDLAVARRVLETEGRGLATLAQALDSRFILALDTLAATQGRVVVTGMGKSGHIARKIAATLASTGTPAQYVHPAEASHGDMGNITRDDAVLALSYSGETPELSDIVAFTRLRKIPLVCIVGRAGTTLDRAADVSLVLPALVEACPLDLAPTTSSTVMLALGDAVAVALYERRGFSREDFHQLHPGGQLGRRFVKVADIMHPGEAIPLAAPDTAMSDALLTMTNKSFGCVGIVEADGRLVGIITDGDLRRHMGATLLARPARDVMTTAPKTVSPSLLAAQALALMNERAITSVFVVEDGRPVGIVHIHDCLRAGIA
ncbi:MAG: SIS domain-containing protein [Rhodospirillales bacterium]